MQPKGFWSYARGDDDHLDGVLTGLRARLEGEISMLLGHDVDIFQDIHDLRTGDRWAETLRGQVTQAAFLIPVLTPRYFNRDWCREETLTFLQVAEEKGLEPLIFPIRFVEYDTEEDCEVRAALAPFQYKEFSGWRLESDPTKRARLEYEFAQDVKARLKLPVPRRPKGPMPETKAVPMAEVSEDARPFVAESKPVVQELVVDQWPGRGDHATIKAAMEAAKPGARIVIRPGTYAENLVLDKPLELIGEGARGEVLVAVTSGDAMQVTASLGLVRNIRFERGEGKGNDVAVWVKAGRCAFEDCSFTSRSISGVDIRGLGTAPQFLRCRFEGSAENGAIVWDQATPKFDACRFAGNGLHGISVSKQADPELLRCVLEDNTYCGAFCYESGRGRFVECEFAGNGLDGVASKGHGRPHLVECRFLENARFGFRAEDADGGGTVERSVFRGNKRRPWSFAKGSEGNVTRRDNVEE